MHYFQEPILIDGVLTCQQFNMLIKNPVEGELIN